MTGIKDLNQNAILIQAHIKKAQRDAFAATKYFNIKPESEKFKRIAEEKIDNAIIITRLLDPLLQVEKVADSIKETVAGVKDNFDW